MESEEFKLMRNKALQQLMSGQSLAGKDGVFAPLLKQFLESALDGEMAAHLDEHERSRGNKRNDEVTKTLQLGSPKSDFFQ
jgi:putative transposase